MNNFIPHSKCIYEWNIKRIHNRRVLFLKDKTCSWGLGHVVLSKEKLKTLFEKNKITNLQYLEGLEILKKFRKRKNKLKENQNA